MTEAEQPLNEAIKLDGELRQKGGIREDRLHRNPLVNTKGCDFLTSEACSKAGSPSHECTLCESPRFITPVKNGTLQEAAWKKDVLNVEPENRVARRRIQEAIDGQSATDQGRSIVCNTWVQQPLKSRTAIAQVEPETVVEEIETPVTEEVQD